MKRNIVFIALGCALVAGCNEKVELTPDVIGEGVYATLEQPDYIETKSLDYSDGKLTFSWANGDQLMVYGQSTSALLRVNEASGTTANVTKLESPDFKLNEGTTYYVFSPVEGTLSESTKEAVNVSFDNQRQVANGSTEHLKKTQYACATATVENNSVNFQLYNQVAWVRYSHAFADGVTASKVVFSAEGVADAFVHSGTLNTTSPVTDKGFTTSITADSNSSSQYFDINLGEESSEGIVVASGETLEVFVAVHPVDLTGKTLKIQVLDKTGNELCSNEYAGRAIKRNAFVSFTDTSAKPTDVASVNGVGYGTVKEAFDAITESGTVRLLSDVEEDTGLFVKAGSKNITLDLGGHTFTAAANVGSTGTQNQVLHLEKGNTVVIKNGTLAASADENSKTKFVIQNYADLTLEDVTIDAANLDYPGQVCYALSNNCGKVFLKGNTSIVNVPSNAPLGAFAMDACKFSSYEAPVVTIATTGKIEGNIELSGGDIVLDEDLTLNGSFKGDYKAESTINLNGHTLTVPRIGVLNHNATLHINNGTIVSKGYVGVMVDSLTETTITSCNIIGVEGAVGTGTASGAVINIVGGEFTATDNAVIAGNGTARDGEANIIIVSDSKLNGKITTKGYIACGVYAPWKDIITLNNVTMNIEGGVGVLCRGGQVYIKGDNGSIVTTGGDVTGWVGDNKNLIPCKALYVDKKANYSDAENAAIVVSGGVYSDDSVKDYLADGYSASKIDGKEAWKVEKSDAVSSTVDFNNALSSASAGEAVSVVLAPNATVELESGVANEGSKAHDITIVGDGTQTFDVVSKSVKSSEGTQMSYQRGSSFTLKNLKIKAGEDTYAGIVCDEITLVNCVITEGKLTLYSKANFIDCVFENNMDNQYSIWTWGGTDVKFENCTFNTNGKAILIYGVQTSESNPTNLTVTGCEFNDRRNGEAGKAVLEVGDYNSSAYYNLDIKDCKINGFAVNDISNSKVWGNKNSMPTSRLSVTIDSVKVY